MNKDQLDRANIINDKIIDYRNRIVAINKIKNEDGKVYHAELTLVVDTEKGGRFSSNYSQNITVIPEIKDLIQEEIVTAAERISRIFEREIRKLEKEFNAL